MNGLGNTHRSAYRGMALARLRGFAIERAHDGLAVLGLLGRLGERGSRSVAQLEAALLLEHELGRVGGAALQAVAANLERLVRLRQTIHR